MRSRPRCRVTTPTAISRRASRAPSHRRASAGDDDGWLDDEYFIGGSAGSFDGDEDGDNDYQDVQAATVSLRDHLLWQLA
jgi:RNA polymerase sigma-54 factor